jgi:hypothetical protein
MSSVFPRSSSSREVVEGAGSGVMVGWMTMPNVDGELRNGCGSEWEHEELYGLKEHGGRLYWIQGGGCKGGDGDDG